MPITPPILTFFTPQLTSNSLLLTCCYFLLTFFSIVPCYWRNYGMNVLVWPQTYLFSRRDISEMFIFSFRKSKSPVKSQHSLRWFFCSESPWNVSGDGYCSPHSIWHILIHITSVNYALTLKPNRYLQHSPRPARALVVGFGLFHKTCTIWTPVYKVVISPSWRWPMLTVDGRFGRNAIKKIMVATSRIWRRLRREVCVAGSSWGSFIFVAVHLFKVLIEDVGRAVTLSDFPSCIGLK